MGFYGSVRRSTLADANDAHDWRIYADFMQVLIAVAHPLHAKEPMGVELDQSLYVLGSSAIDLCLSLFAWARFRAQSGTVASFEDVVLILGGAATPALVQRSAKQADVLLLDITGLDRSIHIEGRVVGAKAGSIILERR